MPELVLWSSLMQEKSSLNFSERFSSAITRAGMNASRLAEKANVSKGYVSGLLSGNKTQPSIEMCQKFAEVLGCSPLWLFAGISETEETEASTLREDATPYRFTPMEKRPPIHTDPDDGLKPVLERIAKALEKLVEIEERRKP